MSISRLYGVDKAGAGHSFRAYFIVDRVVTAIKSGQGKDVKDIYINFALTPRRSALLYEIRMLKKAQNSKLTKFYTDFDGSISVVAGRKGKKERVTSVWRREEGAAGRSRALPGVPGGWRARRGWPGRASSPPCPPRR